MYEKGPNPVFVRLIPRLCPVIPWIMIRLLCIAPGAECQGMLEGVKLGLGMEGLEEELDLTGYY